MSLKVWRAIGVTQFEPTDSLYSQAVDTAGALFVAPTEEQAIAWALHLWHTAPKDDVVSLEVKVIRDKNLEPIEEFQPVEWLEEFQPDGKGGFNIIHYNLVLLEAVILPSDIIGIG